MYLLKTHFTRGTLYPAPVSGSAGGGADVLLTLDLDRRHSPEATSELVRKPAICTSLYFSSYYEN